MKFIFALGTVLIVLFCSASADVPKPVDWSTFLARHDLVWTRNPANWGDGLFIGNGNLGANIWARDGTLTWEINRADVTHLTSRFPIGHLVLKTSGTMTGGQARLTLWDAEGTGTVTTDKGAVHWRTFVATSPSVLVVELQGDGGEKDCTLGWQPAEARPPRKTYKKEPYAPEDLHPSAIVTSDANGVESIQTFLGGGAHAESIRRIDGDQGRRIYYIAIGGNAETGTAPQALSESSATTEAAMAKGLEAMVADHRSWWHAYYPASFLSVPDARLEAFYWIQIYKLGSAVRSDGPTLDLMGPWFAPTPWARIWWNLNLQLAYSPLFAANRLEQAESLFGALDKNRAQLINNVPPELGGKAAAIGTNSGYDLASNVNEAQSLHKGKGTEMGNLPWVVYLYWLYYRDRMDDAILRDRVLPLLKLTTGHYLAFVKKADDGSYHLPTTFSPEYAYAEDCNYDLALLRWSLQTLIESCDRLHINDPDLPQWRDVLDHLTPFPQDDSGLLIGRNTPLKESHRHYSHLLAIYPLHLLNPNVPEDRKLIEVSLASWDGHPEKFKGFSYSGAASMYALLGNGDEALDRLHTMLDRFILPNTLYQESGPCIETPLSAVTSLQEMLFQSWDGILHVFPAVPAAWKDACFDHLRGEGAFLVSAVRHNGETDWVRIESLTGAPCRVRVPDWSSAIVQNEILPEGASGPKVTSNGPGDFSINLPKDAVVVLTGASGGELSPMEPVVESEAERNPYPMRFRDVKK